jgi:hypothetical protein
MMTDDLNALESVRKRRTAPFTTDNKRKNL